MPKATNTPMMIKKKKTFTQAVKEQINGTYENMMAEPRFYGRKIKAGAKNVKTAYKNLRGNLKGLSKY